MTTNLKSVGADWVRITTDWEPTARAWGRLARLIVFPAKAAQRALASARRLGYTGYASDGIFLGSRPDGTMLDMSSETAREYGLWALNKGGRASRLDLQVTLDVGPEIKRIIGEVFKDACAHKYGRGQPPDVEARLGRGGFRSVTIGRRSSQFYARVYDKGEESKDKTMQGWLRYEIEIKAEAAAAVALAWRCAANADAFVLAYVAQWFAAHGVTIFEEMPQPISMPRPSRRKSNEQSKMAWLQRAIAPTVARLMDVVGVQQVMGALVPDGIDLRDIPPAVG